MNIVVPAKKLISPAELPPCLVPKAAIVVEECKCGVGHEIEDRLKKDAEKLVCPYPEEAGLLGVGMTPKTEEPNKIEEPVDTEGEAFAQTAAGKKFLYMKRRYDEFKEKGARLKVCGEINTKVMCAVMSIDQTLRDRKVRLRETLLSEESAYAAEYIALCQQEAKKQEQGLRNRAKALQEQKEKERRELAEKKLTEHMVVNCAEVRPLFVQKRLLQIKKTNLWQIQERNALKEAEREADRMYHDLVIKNMMSMKEMDEENARIQRGKNEAFQASFREQMMWKDKKMAVEKEMKDFEKVQMELEVKFAQEKEQRDAEERARINAAFQAELEDFNVKDRAIKAQRKTDEKAIDEHFFKLAMIELEKDRQKESGNMERRKREMEAFRESMEELRKVKALEEQQIENMIRELQDKERRHKAADMKRLNDFRAQQFAQVMHGRAEQVQEKLARAQREREAEARELELLRLQLEQHEKLHADYERRMCEEKQAYTRQLMAQIADNEEKLRKEKQDKIDFMAALKRQQDKDDNVVKEVLALPLGDRPHPHAEWMHNNPAKHVCPYPCEQ